MRKLYTIAIAALMCTAVSKAYAQSSDDFSSLIKSNAADANKLFNAYSTPMFKGFGVGLNSGWSNTAKTQKLLRFELRISATAAKVPTSDKSFDVTQIGLSNRVTVATTSPTKIAPTFGGSKDAARPVMSINDANGLPTGKTFTMPKGVFGYVPAPDIQLTVGLVHNTDLTIRTIPTIKISDDAGSVGMIGFGIKHNIIQDFAKGVPKLFDLAVAVNYNRVNYSKTLNVQPDAGTAPVTGSNTDFSNQRIDAHFSGFNFQAILSKKLAIFTPFASVAYQTAHTNLGVLGNFPVTATATTYTTITDPIHVDQNTFTGIRADVGFKLDLAIFKVYASVGTGQYVSGNAGIGFGF